MLDLRLSADTERDLDEILDYSIGNWGVHVASRYRDGMSRTLRNLCMKPDLGRPVTGKPGILKHTYRRHIIFFKYDVEALLVLRIVHGARSFDSLL
jgi:plasmid stabilization system protein ParE